MPGDLPFGKILKSKESLCCLELFCSDPCNHEALKTNSYECFLSEDTELPMMYMDDAIDATIKLMTANPEQVKIRSSYNLSGISFTPKQIANSIRKQLPEFKITYKPDFRQNIANSWPSSINDSNARKDWNWKHNFDLDNITNQMLSNLKSKRTD